MKDFKRILAMILALTLCVSLMTPVTAFATENETERDSEQETQASETVADENGETVTADNEPEVKDYETFLACLKVLETYAGEFAAANTSYKVPQLMINYIRTGVERYLDGNWKTLAGEEITVFVDYVAAQDAANGTHAHCLRNIVEDDFLIPNGQQTDFGHMFGALNIAYVSGVASGDLGGWAGDLCDLMQFSRDYGNVPEGTIDEKAAFILEKCFGVDASGAFGMDDFYGDMDAYYINSKVKAGESLSTIFEGYFLETLTDADRAEYFMNNRFTGLMTKEDVRTAVYKAYANNPGLSILEADRELTDEAELRYACCYAFADYLYQLAGDRLTGESGGDEGGNEGGNEGGSGEGEVEKPTGNPYYTEFSSTTSTIAPGVTQTIKLAFTADDKQLAYYIAKVDVARDDLTIQANYKDNDPSKGWGMARVTDQMAAAAENHKHIENYSTVVGVNGDFYNMSTGKPSGALVMEGVTYQGANGANFFAILDDGSAVIGTGSEWNTYKDRVVEAIGGSIMLVRDGKSVVGHYDSYYNSRASRTCVGITADGQVILMVLDGRQEPYSCGGSDLEMAQIMVDAGCVIAMNLDGGGSTTFAAKAEGRDEVTVVNSPSDGYARSVSSSLVVVSTAKISNEFHHAAIYTGYDYLTIGTSLELEAVGVSESGNAAEIPEGATWKVSDDTIGSIADGVFTAIANGDVEVQLVLADGTVVGSRTLHVVVPDNLRFTETSLNAIYGVELEMPVEATYNGNLVAMNEEDVLFLAENESVGVFEGLNFIGDETSGIRVTNVFAILLANDDLFATVRVCLYSSDEAVFDFDNITSGDRQLAWLREVSNATTNDNVLYQVVNPDEEMGIEYTFGLDMTAIEIPELLVDLVGMLPGGDNADATAWDFLLQLAERVSVLTEVRAEVKFDADLEVNYEDLKVVNEYFYLKEVLFDEQTNTMTIICKWVDQTAAIPPETANPICIISGITAKPKEGAAWDAENALAITNTGKVSYNIFLRANALYSFAIQEANQIKYKLYPFDNPDVIIGGTTEKGASFGDVYANFVDSYKLNKSNRQGWYSYENFLYYFVDNEPLTGVQKLPSYEDPNVECFYEFAEDGTCSGTLSGMLEYEGELYFPMLGIPKIGWQTVKSGNVISYYYFDPATGAAVDGKQTIGGYSYEFEDHALVKGQIVTNATGSRYMWAGDFITQAWVEVDGKVYYAHQNAYFMTGLKYQYGRDDAWTWFAFAEDGHVLTEINGIYDYEGERYLVEEGIVNPYAGLVKIDGYYYYFNSQGKAIRDRDYWITKNNDLLPQAMYHFDAKGRMTNPPDGSYVEPDDDDVITPDEPIEPEVKDGFVTEDGKLYYYEDGVLCKDGLIYIDGYYYYARTSNGEVITNRIYWITYTNGYMAEGNYNFDAKGRMTNPPATKPDTDKKDGFVTEGGKLYYYEDGVLCKDGLIYVDGYYYYARTSNGEVITNRTYWATYTNGYMAEGNYQFDAQGRMLNAPAGKPEVEKKDGFVTEDGKLYYYEDGALCKDGLIKVDGYYYYARTSNGEVITNRTYWITYTNGYMAEGNYNFDSKGRMINPPDGSYDKPEDEVVKNGFVKENGGIYHYENGVLSKAGLIKVDGKYYYVRTTTGEVVTSRKYWITYTNGLLKEGNYTFDAQGRIVF